MLVWQTVWENSAQVVLVVAAVACLGVTGSGLAQRWIAARFEDEIRRRLPPEDKTEK
jgi:hypothetical protein